MTYQFNLGLLCLLAIIPVAFGVRILDFIVPEYHIIKSNPPEPLVLDCNYDLEKDDPPYDPVLKWRKDGETIYQWILRQNNPTLLYTKMRDIIDFNYEIDSPTQRFRALSIKAPNINSSGHYECLVTAKNSEHKIAYIQIIDISNITFNVIREEVKNDVQLTCKVENVFPKPTLRLRINETEDIHIQNEEFSKNDDGYFDVAVSGIIKKDIPMEEVSCLMMMPNTTFTLYQSDVVNANNSNRLKATIILSHLLSIILISLNIIS